MLQDLKRKTLIVSVPLLLICLALLVGLGVYLGPSALAALQGPAPLYPEGGVDITALEGQYMAGDIDFIFDWYAETVKDNQTTEREYIVPLEGQDGEAYYIGVAVPASLMDDAQAVLEDTERWMFDEDYEWDGSLLTVRGTVHEMDAETQGYYYDVLRQFGMEESDKDHFLPLVLKHGDIGNANQGVAILGGLLALAVLLFTFWVLLGCLTGRYQQPIRAYLAAQPDPDGAERELDELYAAELAANPKTKVILDRRWLVYNGGTAAFVLAMGDVAWVYQSTTQHRTNGIPTGKSFAVTVCSGSENPKKSRHAIPVKNEADAQALIAQIQTYAPQAAYGYDAAWNNAYKADPAAFQRQVQATRQAARAAAAQGAAAEGAAAQPTAGTAQTAAAEAAMAQPAAADAPAQPGQTPPTPTNPEGNKPIYQ